jgi:hypothetical protein
VIYNSGLESFGCKCIAFFSRSKAALDIRCYPAWPENRSAWAAPKSRTQLAQFRTSDMARAKPSNHPIVVPRRSKAGNIQLNSGRDWRFLEWKLLSWSGVRAPLPCSHYVTLSNYGFPIFIEQITFIPLSRHFQEIPWITICLRIYLTRTTDSIGHLREKTAKRCS